MSYPYEQIFAGDPSAPERVAVNGVVTIFEPGDATMTPLTITTLDGLPLANPMQVNESGFGPAFQHDTLDQVAWAGGGFTGILTSYKGMKEVAVAAGVSASAAAIAAQLAASNSTAPTAEAVEREIVTEGTAARAAVELVANEAAAQVAAPKLDKEEAGRTLVSKARSDSARIALGNEALSSLPENYNLGTAGTVLALGHQALGATREAKKTIAIGTGAMSQGTVNRDNIAIGESALRYVQSSSADYTQADLSGTRNIAVGGNSGRFVTSGYSHTLIGRNAGQCLIGGFGAVAIGANAMAGTGPIGLSGEIENGAPWGGSNPVLSVAIGYSAAMSNTAENNIAIGGDALRNVKRSDYNVAVGPLALKRLDDGTGYHGGLNVELNLPGTYTQAGSALVLTVAGHGLEAGDTAQIKLLDGASQTFMTDIAQAAVSSVPDANTFTLFHPIPRLASGSAVLVGKETKAQQPLNQYNVAVGNAAAALRTGSWNTAVGGFALNLASQAGTTAAFGYKALTDVLSSAGSVAVGANAASRMAGHALNVTAVGSGALQAKSDGTPLTDSWSNITGIGAGAAVSGSNQVQLGNSAATTYVYGTVQNRSDARDKADIRDTVLGLDFIEKLRPVDFKWDMRDDYYAEDSEGNKTPIEKDGSKKRTRYHHGFVAQEVQQVIEETGEDFGGLQDHTLNGGSDILSIGYDEVIAPIVKAMQEMAARIRELEARDSRL